MFGRLKLWAVAAGLALCVAAQAQEVNFGIISTDSSAALKEKWQPFFDDMEKQTGLKVNSFYAPDYAGVIEGMRFNKVQIAWYGNKAAMEAVDRANGEVFAQIIFADGSLGYYSLLLVHRDSPIKSLDDVIKNGKNYSFGNGDPNSTSGFLVPSYYVFALNKIDPKTHFKVMRSGSHAANMLAVLNKQIDVATNNTEQWDKMKAENPAKLDELRVIWKSPLIPSDPLVWRKDLDPAIKAKVKTFVLGYGNTERGRAVMKNIYSYGGFRESTNAQLIPVRQLELFRDKTKLESDTAMNPQERAAKIAEIDAKLMELNRQASAK